MTDEVLINGRRESAIPYNDRGLAYGDGLFETLRISQGRLPLEALHLERLQAGAERLGLPFDPSLQQLLRQEIRALAAARRDGVLKIILTRGVGGRGYAPPPEPSLTRIVAAFPLVPRDAANGVHVRVCRTRLALQPQLAGLKHLNRLEQVLARREWQDTAIAEGLMLDMEGQLVEGTLSNLFLLREGRLLTPRLDRCGVAGVMRRFILQHLADWGLTGDESWLSLSDLATADEVFLCNSVQGIWPVTRVDHAEAAWRYPVGRITERLMNEVQALWS